MVTIAASGYGVSFAHHSSHIGRYSLMTISVIIPVYNAAPFVEEAVASALCQPETAELLLIEDGSPDASLLKCQTLVQTDPRIRLFRHPKGKNRGASASRNLGIVNARCDYVAFLDADDLYLPNRFSVARSLFGKSPGLEGVYEATGTRFESEDAECRWKEMNGPLITTVKAGVPADSIFEQQSPMGSAGHCHLNALTVKRSVFDKSGLFDVDVDFGEDTVFFMKLAACARIQVANVGVPVAMRRVHATNRITRIRSAHEDWILQMAVWLTVYRWLRTNSPDAEREKLVLNRMLWQAHGTVTGDCAPFKRFLISLYRYVQTLCREPVLIRERVFVAGVLKNLYVLLR
jgi:cellulose synthase/poly-beta-1,6-N-acetylglucosamine synthase-like glycosyltransferase